MIQTLIFLFMNPKLALGLYGLFGTDKNGQVVADTKTGKIIYANKSFLRHIGRTIEELRETPFIDFVYEEDKESTLEVMMGMVKDHKTVYDFENRYLKPDGTLVTIKWRSITQWNIYIAHAELL